MQRSYLLIALAISAAGGAAQAAPITYEVAGQISVSLAGADFTLGNFSLSLASDTDTVFRPRPTRPTLYNSAPSTLRFDINGVTGTFDTPFNAFSFTFPEFQGVAAVGFTEVDPPFAGDDIINVFDPNLVGYDLRSPVSTLTNSPIEFLNFNTPYQTSAGVLIFSNDDNASARFTSTLAPVPIPASWAMMAAGLLAMGVTSGMIRRQRV